MVVQIKSVQFDFELDGETLPLEQQQDIISRVVGESYIVDDVDSIADAIADNTGWAVSSVDYDIVSEENEYELFVDIEVTEWRRLYINVPSTSLEEAKQYAQDVFEKDGVDGLEETFGNDFGWESLPETADLTGRAQLWCDDDILHSIGEY